MKFSKPLEQILVPHKVVKIKIVSLILFISIFNNFILVYLAKIILQVILIHFYFFKIINYFIILNQISRLSLRHIYLCYLSYYLKHHSIIKFIIDYFIDQIKILLPSHFNFVLFTNYFNSNYFMFHCYFIHFFHFNLNFYFIFHLFNFIIKFIYFAL
jgi:hypothetical protein